jgi:hypothetical protein
MLAYAGVCTQVCGMVLYMCTLTFFTKMASLLVWTILVKNKK